MADMLSRIITSLERVSAGKALLGINVFSTALAAATNTFAVATDKNTSAEDKKFLVPAGIATGFANVGLYLAFTLKVIDKLEKSANNVIKNMTEKGTLEKNALNFANKSIENASKGLFKKKPEFIADMRKYLLKDGKITQKGLDVYKSEIKGAASVTGALVGAVVAYGILSPIIRDVSAYFVQKHMEKTNPSYKDKPYRPYFDPGHFKVGYANQKQPLNMNTYMAFTRAKRTNSLSI